jgi:hypothetical protein
MKNIIGFAVGAAIAGGLAIALLKRQSARRIERSRGELAKADEPEVIGRGTGSGFTMQELIADTPAAQNILNS